jgi:hypothetical protein
MNKQDAVLCYKTAMTVFENWMVSGLISEEELLAIDTITAEKYGLTSCSIYRRNDLICAENRANIDMQLYKGRN